MPETNKEKNIKENNLKKEEVKESKPKETKKEVKDSKTTTEKKQESAVKNEVKETVKKEESKKFEQVKTEKENSAKIKKEKPKKEKPPKEKKEKKGVAVRIIIIVIVLLAIIGLIYLAIPSPEKVVNNTFSDLKNGDFENIEQYINYNELVEDTGMNYSQGEMTEEEKEKEKLLYEDLQWSIKSVQTEENTAIVEVETTNKDYRTIFNNYFQTLIQKVFSNEDLTDEQIEDSFVEELQKEDVEKVTTTQTINLVKQDGKWRIVVDENLKNAIYPGLEDAINSINNIVG